MRDYLSWQNTHFWQKDIHFNTTEPVTRDHLSWEAIFLWQMGWSFKKGSAVYHHGQFPYFLSPHTIINMEKLVVMLERWFLRWLLVDIKFNFWPLDLTGNWNCQKRTCAHKTHSPVLSFYCVIPKITYLSHFWYCYKDGYMEKVHTEFVFAIVTFFLYLQTKGLTLSNSDVIRQVHNSFARFVL